MKTLLAMAMMAVSMGATGMVRAGDAAWLQTESEIRAQGRRALMVIETAQRARLPFEHRRALARAESGIRARVAARYSHPGVDRALAGVRAELADRFRALPPRGAPILWQRHHAPSLADERRPDRDAPRRGWARYPAMTPR